MLEELASELIVTGFVAFIHRLSEMMNQPQTEKYPELSGLNQNEYQQLVERFAGNWELN